MFTIFFKKIVLDNNDPLIELGLWNLLEIAGMKIIQTVFLVHFAMDNQILLFFIIAKVTFLCNQCFLHGNGGCRFPNEVSCLCSNLLFDWIWRDPVGSYLGTREGLQLKASGLYKQQKHNHKQHFASAWELAVDYCLLF